MRILDPTISNREICLAKNPVKQGLSLSWTRSTENVEVEQLLIRGPQRSLLWLRKCFCFLLNLGQQLKFECFTENSGFLVSLHIREVWRSGARHSLDYGQPELSSRCPSDRCALQGPSRTQSLLHLAHVIHLRQFSLWVRSSRVKVFANQQKTDNAIPALLPSSLRDAVLLSGKSPVFHFWFFLDPRSWVMTSPVVL